MEIHEKNATPSGYDTTWGWEKRYLCNRGPIEKNV